MITYITHHSCESQSGVIAYWQTYAGNFSGLQLVATELDVVDYDLGGGERVERKLATDFSLAIILDPAIGRA